MSTSSQCLNLQFWLICDCNSRHSQSFNALNSCQECQTFFGPNNRSTDNTNGPPNKWIKSHLILLFLSFVLMKITKQNGICHKIDFVIKNKDLLIFNKINWEKLFSRLNSVIKKHFSLKSFFTEHYSRHNYMRKNLYFYYSFISFLISHNF